MRRVPGSRCLFENIPWSTERALAATLERSVENRIPLYRTPPLSDIDTEEDYQRALRSPLGPSLRKAYDLVK